MVVLAVLCSHWATWTNLSSSLYSMYRVLQEVYAPTLMRSTPSDILLLYWSESMQTYWWLSEVPRSIATSHFKAPDALFHERSSLPPPDTASRAVGREQWNIHEAVSVTKYQMWLLQRLFLWKLTCPYACTCFLWYQATSRPIFTW